MLHKVKILIKKIVSVLINIRLTIHKVNWKIHRKFAIYFCTKKRWERSIFHWKKADETKQAKLLPKDYLQYATALQKMNKENESIKILTVALTKYPTNKDVIIALSNFHMTKEQWKKASDVLIKLFEIEEMSIPIKAYNDLATLYIKQGLYNRAEYIFKRGMELYPENGELLNNYVDLAIYQKNWDLAIKRIEYLLFIYQLSMDSLIKLSMLYQLKGRYREAKNIFHRVLDKHQQAIKTDEKKYRKIVLFDNGESRIEFYKNLKQVNQVVITFDTLFMDWDEPSFGFNFILRQNADIIAVRKRRKLESQQYLTQEDFVETVQLLVNGYADKVAYGHSLGGYTALYYASKLNCRILSLAPRISIHPIYGKKGEANRQKFKHRLSHDYNDHISPVIVYDPKDKQDNTYVHKELLVAYPNAQLVEMYYGGHGIARHLLRMGSLKEFLLTFLEGKTPTYDRSLKGKSANYCRLLGRECLRRNKLKWAWELSERSVQLVPKDRHVIKFRVDVLKKFNKMDEAIEYAKQSVKKSPNSIHLRLILIDLYIEKRELIFAEREVKLAVNKFKDAPELTKRMKKIDSMWAKEEDAA